MEPDVSIKTKQLYCNEVEKTVFATYELIESGTPSKVVSAFLKRCSASEECSRGLATGKDWDNTCIAFKYADQLRGQSF